MTGNSKIEWTEQTWNPIVGCSIVSPGCTNCYAMAMAARINKMTLQSHYEGLTKKVNGKQVWTGKLAPAGEWVFNAPLRRRKPTTYFVNSMGDLFHEAMPDEWIDRVFAIMALTPRHTYQVLTKRAARMRDYLNRPIDWNAHLGAIFTAMSTSDRVDLVQAKELRHGISSSMAWPLPNVWLGVSVERQQEADERIPYLLGTPAAVRFLSCEPLLSAIDLIGTFCRYQDGPRRKECAVGLGRQLIDWVIVGGESGFGARPMHPGWARDLRDQCGAAGISFFFKQWGEWSCLHNAKEGDYGMIVGNGLDDDHNFPMVRVGKKVAGRLLDGIEHNAMPERAA